MKPSKLSDSDLQKLAIGVLEELHRRDLLSIAIPLIGPEHGNPPAPHMYCCSGDDIEDVIANGPMVDIGLDRRFGAPLDDDDDVDHNCEPPCSHGLPLTLRPMMLYSGKNGDPNTGVIMTEAGTTLAEAHHAISLMEKDDTGAIFRIAFASEVKDEEEAERYHAGHWSDETGQVFAIWEPPTEDGFCANPDCHEELHAVGCIFCDKTLGVFIHSSGTTPELQ